jgi:hypothetical protein
MLAIVVALALAQHSARVYKEPGVPGYRGEFPLKYERPLAESLALTVEPLKSYQPSEPVEIDIIATNVSDAPILCICVLYGGSIEIEVRRGREPFRVLPSSLRYPEVLPLYELKPGEAVKRTAQLLALYDSATGASPFETAGHYEIRVTYFDSEDRTPESRIQSAPVALEVAPPDDPDALAAYRGDLALLVHRSGGGAPTDTLLRKADRFLTRFPSSLYAPGVRRALAAMLRWRVYDEHGRLRDDATSEHRALYEKYRR